MFSDYGFMTFQNIRNAEGAIRKWNCTTINGNRILMGKLEAIEDLKDVVLQRRVCEGDLPKYYSFKINGDFHPLKLKNSIESKCGTIERNNVKNS